MNIEDEMTWTTSTDEPAAITFDAIRKLYDEFRKDRFVQARVDVYVIGPIGMLKLRSMAEWTDRNPPMLLGAPLRLVMIPEHLWDIVSELTNQGKRVCVVRDNLECQLCEPTPTPEDEG